MSKKCLINVEGGLGKNVMLTSILQEFKTEKGYDEIYVISPYFDVFKACSAVTDAFPPMQGTLYQELVLDEECDIYWKEPYSNQRFIKKQCHLLDAWAEELGFELIHEASTYTPLLDKIPEEYPAVQKAVNEQINAWKDGFCLVQFNGGQSPLTPMQDKNGQPVQYRAEQESLKRNYFKGEKVVQRLKHKHGVQCTIVHFALPNEPTIGDTVKIQLPYLAYHLMAAKAKEIICIDSSLQHLATGVNDNITVIWGETRPEHFGYRCNRNICAENVLNSQPYFKPLGVSPSIVKMPEPKDIVPSSDEYVTEAIK